MNQAAAGKFEMHPTVIIVNYNVCDRLRACLSSLFASTQSNLKVIVVDNDSWDKSAEMVAREFPQVQWIQNHENVGFGAACNLGLQAVQSDYALLLNPDSIVYSDSLSKCMEVARKDQQTAIIGCKITDENGRPTPSCMQYPSQLNMFLQAVYLNKIFPKSRFFGRERFTWWDHDEEREVPAVSGCFLLLNMDYVRKFGAFDPIFFMYAEESDLCLRWRQKGGRIVFTPEATVTHIGGESSKQHRFAMTKMLWTSKLKFIQKHHKTWELFLAKTWCRVFFILRVPFWLALFLTKPTNRKRNWQITKDYLQLGLAKW